MYSNVNLNETILIRNIIICYKAKRKRKERDGIQETYT